jgi:hypothetical protein
VPRPQRASALPGAFRQARSHRSRRCPPFSSAALPMPERFASRLTAPAPACRLPLSLRFRWNRSRLRMEGHTESDSRKADLRCG